MMMRRAFSILACLLHVSTAFRLDESAFPFLRGRGVDTSDQQDRRSLQEGGTPYQSPQDLVGPSYASGISYNKASKALHITGSTFGNAWGEWSGATPACFYAVLDVVNDQSPTAVYSTTIGNDGVSQACSNVLVDEAFSKVFIVGHSLSGGPLQELENVASLIDTVMFGMVADLQYTDIGNKAEPPTLIGGGVLQGSEVVYPIGIAKEEGENVVYVVSMELDGNRPNNEYSDGLRQDPSQVFQYGNDYSMRVAAHPLNTSTTATGLTQTMLAHTWTLDLSPKGENSAVENIAGIVKLGDYIFVGGSTAGDGTGFGERNEDGNDIDGFVTRISANDGNIPTQTQVQNELGSNPTWRAWSFSDPSGTGSQERINGVCVSERQQSFVFATGWTEGHVENAEVETRQKRAFLAKIRISDMSAVWTEHIEGNISSADVQGISCVVSGDGSSVYFAGNVKNGFIPGSGTSNSFGDSDVFITKVDVGGGDMDGQVLFTRQFGTSASDTLAARNGLEMVGDSGDNVVIVGNTEGSMYRSKAVEETDFSTLFAVVMSSDGRFTPPASTSPGHVPSTPAAPPATPVNPTPSTPATTVPPPVTTPAPPTPSPPPPSNNELSKAKSRRREKWEALTIVLIVGICATVLAMCTQQYLYHKREASTDRVKVLDYLQNFDVEDIDLKHSATGGWHCSYVNDLARGINNQHSLSLDRGFMGEADYQETAFDPLNSAASPPTSPESKVLEDSLFVIDDGEEMLTFGNDRSTRDGLGSAYRDTWRSSSRDLNGKGKNKSRRNLTGRSRSSRKKDTWGSEII